MKRYFTVPSIISTVESGRTSDRWLLRIVLAAVVIAAVWFILSLNSFFSVTDVRAGGNLNEGIIGTPRFVNPVLARTRADQDVTQLVYSGLFSIDSTGNVVPNIANAWSVSEDGTIYTITLRDNVQFHDDVPLTSADVLYTIDLIQNTDLFVPPVLRNNWIGVTASAIDDHTVELKLQEPYAPFVESLTIGILPVHVWRSVPIDQIPFSTHNTAPIGSGPYKIKDTMYSKTGTVTSYELAPAEQHTPTALISTIQLKFYGDESELISAWEQGEITSTAYLPAQLVPEIVNNELYQLDTAPLTRTFGLFFNQNRSEVLRDAAVREALELAIDRDTIVSESLYGAGIPSFTAVTNQPDAIESEEGTDGEGFFSSVSQLDTAKEVLEAADWNQTESGNWVKTTDDGTTELQVTIRTENTPVLDATLKTVVENWEALGVTVATEQFTQSDLKNFIREREFEVLLFAVDPRLSQDLYPFWHSSQQDDPGLNVSQYANLTVDEFLEEARSATDPTTAKLALETVSTVIQEERPAIFLFRPTMQYVSTVDMTTQLPQYVATPSDRLSTIANWYTEERMLWPFFTNRTDQADATTDLNTEQ